MVLHHRRGLEHLFAIEGGARLVGPHDVRERNRPRHRLDVREVEGLDVLGMAEDVGELVGEPFELLIAQAEAGQLGDLGHLCLGDGRAAATG